MGYPLPSEVDYDMKYKITAESTEDVVYLGVHVYRQEHLLRTELYDREEEYPFHIMRYPHSGTVATSHHLKGVIIGRLGSCLQVCSFMGDFKASALRVIQRAFQRGYSKRIIQSVWVLVLGLVFWVLGFSSILAKWRRSQAAALKGWFRVAWRVAASDGRAGGQRKLVNHHQRNYPELMQAIAEHDALHPHRQPGAAAEDVTMAAAATFTTSSSCDSLSTSRLPEAISLFPDSYSFQPPQPPPSPPPPPFRPLVSVCGVEPHLEPMVSTVQDEDEELVACNELALHALRKLWIVLW